MSTDEYRFNWHQLNEHMEDEGFLLWLIVNLVVQEDGGDDVYHLVKAASNGFKDVELKIQLNGIHVDPRHFVRNVGRNMRQFAQDSAAEQLRELTDFGVLFDQTGALIHAFQTKVREVAVQLGVEDEYDQQVRND